MSELLRAHCPEPTMDIDEALERNRLIKHHPLDFPLQF